jgi:hypothetical protein
MGKDRLPQETKSVRAIIEKSGSVEPCGLAPDTSTVQQQGTGAQQQEPRMSTEPAQQGQTRMTQPDAQLLIEKYAKIESDVEDR